MGAALPQYRPVADNEGGGLTGKVDISLEMGPVVCTLFAQTHMEGIQERPHKLVIACRAFPYLSALTRTRTWDLLLRRQSLYPPEL